MAVDVPDVMVTRLDKLASWCRKNSLSPMPFATACCGIELMATGASRHDIARFGAEAMRFSPRQCDLMIVAGRVVMKMLPVLQRIWLQMPEPKWCISMGACASSGGVFDTYAVVQGIDRFIPVDVYVPGCPPRPEQLLQSVLDIQDRVMKTGTITGREFRVQTEHRGPISPEQLNVSPESLIVGRVTSRRRHDSTTIEDRVMAFSDTVKQLQSRFGNDSIATSEFRDNKRLIVAPAKVYSVLELLKRDAGFDMLVDLSAADYLHYPDAKDRYGVWYVLLNTKSGERLIVKTWVNDPDPTLPSVYGLWKGSDWMEREVYDMYGVVFEGHPDLRRILLPDEFSAFPMRKDYPLRGRGERHNFPVITRAES